MLCCGYTLTDFPISTRLTSLALWQSNDCPSASKATLMNMDKYFMWIHYERLHNHNKAKYNKTVCIFLGIYCIVYVSVCHVITHLYLNFNSGLVKPPNGGLVKLPLKLMHWWVNISYVICMLITYPSPNISKSMLAKWSLNTAIPFKFTFVLDNSFAASQH